MSTSAVAQALSGTPTAHNPYSRTASAITGPIMISDSRLIFSTGTVVPLEVVDTDVVGEWGLGGEILPVQILMLKSDPGELLNGNTICGSDEGPNYMVAYKQEGFLGTWLLELAIFSSEAVPTSITSDGLCGTYNYVSDAPYPEPS